MTFSWWCCKRSLFNGNSLKWDVATNPPWLTWICSQLVSKSNAYSYECIRNGSTISLCSMRYKFEGRKKKQFIVRETSQIHSRRLLLFPINKLYKLLFASIECDIFSNRCSACSFSSVLLSFGFFYLISNVFFYIWNDCIAIKFIWIFNLFSFTHFEEYEYAEQQQQHQKKLMIDLQTKTMNCHFNVAKYEIVGCNRKIN